MRQYNLNDFTNKFKFNLFYNKIDENDPLFIDYFYFSKILNNPLFLLDDIIQTGNNNIIKKVFEQNNLIDLDNKQLINVFNYISQQINKLDKKNLDYLKPFIKKYYDSIISESHVTKDFFYEKIMEYDFDFFKELIIKEKFISCDILNKILKQNEYEIFSYLLKNNNTMFQFIDCDILNATSLDIILNSYNQINDENKEEFRDKINTLFYYYTKKDDLSIFNKAIENDIVDLNSSIILKINDLSLLERYKEKIINNIKINLDKISFEKLEIIADKIDVTVDLFEKVSNHENINKIKLVFNKLSNEEKKLTMKYNLEYIISNNDHIKFFINNNYKFNENNLIELIKHKKLNSENLTLFLNNSEEGINIENLIVSNILGININDKFEVFLTYFIDNNIKIKSDIFIDFLFLVTNEKSINQAFNLIDNENYSFNYLFNQSIQKSNNIIINKLQDKIDLSYNDFYHISTSAINEDIYFNLIQKIDYQDFINNEHAIKKSCLNSAKNNNSILDKLHVYLKDERAIVDIFNILLSFNNLEKMDLIYHKVNYDLLYEIYKDKIESNQEIEIITEYQNKKLGFLLQDEIKQSSKTLKRKM